MAEDSPEERHVYTTKTQYELTDLQRFTEYAVWVIAINTNGPGSPSQEVTVRTLSALPLDPPMNVTVEPASTTVRRIQVLVYNMTGISCSCVKHIPDPKQQNSGPGAIIMLRFC